MNRQFWMNTFENEFFFFEKADPKDAMVADKLVL